MFEEKARIARPDIPAGRRVIVTSDIHGNLPYFKGLLSKVHFSADDILIIDGDFQEKGPDSLGTLRFIMELCRGGNVWPVLGNCDAWQLVLTWGKRSDEHISRYLRKRKSGLIWEMLLALGADPLSLEHFSDYLPALGNAFKEEFAFLSSLPHAIDSKNFTFVHAGLDGSKPLDENSADELTVRDAFLREGQRFDKWIVTGHWPCVLYGGDIVNANPIIDAESRIIALDGGCVLKDDGQLNALIIPDISDPRPEAFLTEYYDPFPLRQVLDGQCSGERSYYIRWGDSDVEVLSRGEEFSRCRHVRTGYEMDILTRYLFTDNPVTACNDCTDYILPLKPGDTVGVVEETSRGYFVKHNGISGWYSGRLGTPGKAEA